MNIQDDYYKALNNDEEFTKLPFDILVTFEVDNQLLESTPIRPIMTAEGEIDDQALSDYYCFILELLFELDDAGLVVIDEHNSNISETSKYYTLADEEQFKNDDMKYIIYLRISDHVLQLTEKQKKLINQKRKEESSKLKVKWKVKNVVVNDNLFTSYDEAIEYVSHKVEEYKQALKNHQEENR